MMLALDEVFDSGRFSRKVKQTETIPNKLPPSFFNRLTKQINMIVHKLEVMIIDFDGLGLDEIKLVLENANYPNDCIRPTVMKAEAVDIGEWDDENPLNNTETQDAEYERLFKPSK